MIILIIILYFVRKYTNRIRGDLDDILGGFMLTLIDSLDSLLLFKEYSLFFDALKKLKSVTFHRNIDISVFEVNIRILGGLLSAHQLASKLFMNNNIHKKNNFSEKNDSTENNVKENDVNKNNENNEKNRINSKINKNPQKNSKKSEASKNAKNYNYDGVFLLNLAIDIGDRLLPAFSTKTATARQTAYSDKP